MAVYNIKDIPPGSFFSKPVYLDNDFILASPEMPFTAAMIHALDEWEFTDIISEGEIGTSYARESTDTPGEGAGEAPEAAGDRLIRAEKFYLELRTYVEQLFMYAAIGTALEFNELSEKMKQVSAVVREDHISLLRVLGSRRSKEDGDFLTAHTAEVTVISLIIGQYLKLPPHRLIELGIAALVHEIGMIKIPRRIYSARRPLSSEERMRIITHPAASYHILKSNGFPLSISIAALQHHERENGSGYPQMLTGEKISLYAKIIAVACSYEALTANRPHKDAKDEHSGIMDLLRNEGKSYDDTVIRALVYSLSLYPIGLCVLLSSGRKGQVVDVNPQNPRFPVVRIFGEFTPDQKNKTEETSAGGLRIVRPLTREEIRSIPGFKG